MTSLVTQATFQYVQATSLMILGQDWSSSIPTMHVHVHVLNTLVIRTTKCWHIHTSCSWDLVEPSWVAWAWFWLSADCDDSILGATYRKRKGYVQGCADTFALTINLPWLQILEYLILANQIKQYLNMPPDPKLSHAMPAIASLTAHPTVHITPESYEKIWKENFLLLGINNLV